MKILQVPFNYYPEPVGGTEVYVAALSRELRAQGFRIAIAAVGKREEYEHDGFPVHRFGLTENPDLRILYGSGDPIAIRDFTAILDRTAPDLVHLHAFSPAVSASTVGAIRKRGIPIVFTCHIPGVLCARSTLLRHGTEECDGIWGLRKCSSCCLENGGLTRPLANAVGSLPAAVGKTVAKLGWSSSQATGIRMTELQTIRHRTLVEFFGGVDRIIAVCNWLKEMIAANGIPSEKIVLCRHGSAQEGVAAPTSHSTHAPGPIKIAYLGRLHASKGTGILVEALRRRPDLPIEMDFFGIVQDAPDYAEALRKAAAPDSRISFRPSIPNDQVVERLRGYHALAVPSQWMETGPLVVYDAFSAGIPVVGSDRGGIAELVQHGRNGLLVPPSDIDAWGAAFARLRDEAGLLESLRSGVRAGRTMKVVADEIAHIYADTLKIEHSSLAAGERN